MGSLWLPIHHPHQIRTSHLWWRGVLNSYVGFHMDDTLNENVKLLMNMLRIPSFSGDEERIAHFLVNEAKKLGFISFRDDVGNFVACSQVVSYEQRPLILLGHMDTVRGEIPVTLNNNLLYGRGAVDAKGALAVFICASARLLQRGIIKRPLIIIGAVEEEVASSKGAKNSIHQYQPSACIIGEPSGSHAVTLGYKGRLLVEASITISSGHNARPMSTASEKIVHFWEEIYQHAQRWNDAHNVTSLFHMLSPSLQSIQGSQQNGLSDEAHLMVDYRLPPDFDCSALRQQITQWALNNEVTVTFAEEEQAYHSPRTSFIANAFVTVLRNKGKRPSFKYKTGSSDMNIVGPHWGPEIVAYGPGDSKLDHTPYEHLSIDEYQHAIDVLEKVLEILVV